MSEDTATHIGITFQSVDAERFLMGYAGMWSGNADTAMSMIAQLHDVMAGQPAGYHKSLRKITDPQEWINEYARIVHQTSAFLRDDPVIWTTTPQALIEWERNETQTAPMTLSPTQPDFSTPVSTGLELS